MGSCCGSVGRAVASIARGPRFESSHQQTFRTDINLSTVNCIEKTKINKKRPGIAYFEKNALKTSQIEQRSKPVSLSSEMMMSLTNISRVNDAANVKLTRPRKKLPIYLTRRGSV